MSYFALISIIVLQNVMYVLYTFVKRFVNVSRYTVFDQMCLFLKDNEVDIIYERLMVYLNAGDCLYDHVLEAHKRVYISENFSPRVLVYVF